MGLLPLAAALVVLMLDSAIELALISSMVGYLHRSGANKYPFRHGTGVSTIQAKPKGLMVDQGHTSNGAAGTALVVVSLGGFLVLFLQRRRAKKNTTGKPSRLFLAYTIFTCISAVFTLAALAYTFTLTNQTKGNRINPTLASKTPVNDRYPADKWTPATWTKALLALPLDRKIDQDYLRGWLKVMEGWKWNLIPMFLIGVVVAGLAVMACLEERSGYRRPAGVEREKETDGSI